MSTGRKPPKPMLNKMLDLEAEEDNEAEEEDCSAAEEDSFINDDEESIQWSRTPSPVPDKKKRVYKRVETPPLTTRSRTTASDGTDRTAESIGSPEHLGPKHNLNTTGYEGSALDAIQGVKSPSVHAPTEVKSGRKTQRKLETKLAKPAMKASDYSANDYALFLDFMALQTQGSGAKNAEQVTASAEDNSRKRKPNEEPAAELAPSIKPPARKTKKARKSSSAAKGSELTEVPVEGLDPSTSSGIVDTSKSKGKRKSNPKSDGRKPLDHLSLPEGLAESFASATTPVSGSKPGAKRNDKAAQKDEKVDQSEQMLDPVVHLPRKCQVTDPALQDKFLKADYKYLPKLLAAALISWSPKDGNGNILLSTCRDFCSTLNPKVAYMLLSFVSEGRYVNLARISPTLLRAVAQIYTKGKSRYTLSINESSAICLSFAMVVVSSLLKIGRVTGDDSSKSPLMKFITAILFTQEFERTIGAMGMAFHQSEMHAQIAENAITFSTRSVPKSGTTKATSKKPNYVGIQSPAARSGTSHGGMFSDALAATDEVPIYDARGIEFDLNRDVENLDKLLPRYENDEDGEIPSRSLALLAYTVTQYINGDGNPAVSFNIQWVVVIAEPDANE